MVKNANSSLQRMSALAKVVSRIMIGCEDVLYFGGCVHCAFICTPVASATVSGSRVKKG